MATDPGIVVVPKHLLSRLLYTNPVCLLTSHDPATRRRNVMTISWLTAINNQGGFICSMNAKRATAPIVQAAGGFGTRPAAAGACLLTRALGRQYSTCLCAAWNRWCWVRLAACVVP